MSHVCTVCKQKFNKPEHAKCGRGPCPGKNPPAAPVLNQIPVTKEQPQ